MAGHRVRSKLLFAHRRHAYGQTQAKFPSGNFQRPARIDLRGVTLRREGWKNAGADAVGLFRRKRYGC